MTQVLALVLVSTRSTSTVTRRSVLAALVRMSSLRSKLSSMVMHMYIMHMYMMQVVHWSMMHSICSTANQCSKVKCVTNLVCK